MHREIDNRKIKVPFKNQLVMIEDVLIKGGLGCGTVKNFALEIQKGLEQNKTTRWYFKTPIKITGSGLKSATVNLAFPFKWKESDIDEKTVLARLEVDRKEYEQDLLKFLRKFFIVPPDTANFVIIPFFSKGEGERDERKNFGGTIIHILSANLIIKYRDSWF